MTDSTRALGLHLLPNALTLSRMALTVPLAHLVLAQRYGAALMVALIAGLTDALDGLLAKRFDWRTRLGGLLDPLADKLLLTVSFVILAMDGSVPVWMAALVVARDLVIVAGALAYHRLIEPVIGRPSQLSRVNTVLQIALVLWTLVSLAFGLDIDWVDAPLLGATALTTALSGVDYIVRWGGRAWRFGRDDD